MVPHTDQKNQKTRLNDFESSNEGEADRILIVKLAEDRDQKI